MTEYNPAVIEKKWHKKWSAQKLYRTADSVRDKDNKMVLVEFPYPSGNLHMGHWYAFALPDMYARYWRMRGFNVLYPIGFDAFGLPAENAAIQRNIHPEEWTTGNIATMTSQMESMGTMFDFSRVVSTIDPSYYRWTQWMFLRMLEKDLAYRAKTTVNWCPKDKTVLANEQVVDGCCERCGTSVQQRELEQWMMRITKYADRLIDDIQGLDWPYTTQAAQQHWIGRSQGARIIWKLTVPGQPTGKHQVETFTTRPDTIFGVTFLVVSPEVAKKWMDVGWAASDGVQAYVKRSLAKRELERQEEKEKTGVDTGVTAVHPFTGDQVPVWVADYVLGSYGTGAIMAVPAHDERDQEFAKKFDLPIKEIELEDSAAIIQKLQAQGAGGAQTTYKLRDWVLSRQRYWGVPIPVVHCPECGYVPVSDKDLPVKLPPLEDFKPADDGRSPLAKATDWLHTTCPKCKGPAERETDTMDTFVDSSWYYLRYTDPDNTKKFADPKKIAAWLPVSMYVGGSEHNTMHLLYSRFFAKVLSDLGYLNFPKGEPFIARRNHGFVLGPDGQKMSKSRGNVVDPDKEVERFGADTVRMYLAFLGPYEQDKSWDPKGINGVARFLKRSWTLFAERKLLATGGGRDDIDLARAMHGAIKKIGEDVSQLHLNTCVSELMKLLNVLEAHVASLSVDHGSLYAVLLAPFAPHLAEELWMGVLKKKESVHLQPWPDYDPSLLVTNTVQLPVQVNGRLRAVIAMAHDAPQDAAVFAAHQDENVAKYLGDREPSKVIYIAGKMLNLVTD